MKAPLFERHAIRMTRRYHVLGPVLLALICGIGAGVVAFQGKPAMMVYLPHLGGAAAVGVGLTLLAILTLRSRVRVARVDGVRRLEVEDGAASVSLALPAHYEHGWFVGESSTGRSTFRYPVLVVCFYDDDAKLTLVLEEQLGSLHEPPRGWPQRELSGPSDITYTNIVATRLHLDDLVQHLGASRRA
jgi:hypothetical protein